MYVLDTYAWIEYFSNGENSARIADLLESREELFTPTIVLAEAKRKLIRELSKDRKAVLADMLRFMKTRSLIVDLNWVIAEKAAEIVDTTLPDKSNFGLADAIVLATARTLGAKVVTGDEHFKGLKDVVFIK